jgi:hypothetical protein
LTEEKPAKISKRKGGSRREWMKIGNKNKNKSATGEGDIFLFIELLQPKQPAASPNCQ